MTVGGFGSVSALLASYEAARGILSEYWIYPVAVAVIGVFCTVIAMMERAWPQRVPEKRMRRGGDPIASDGEKRFTSS